MCLLATFRYFSTKKTNNLNEYRKILRKVDSLLDDNQEKFKISCDKAVGKVTSAHGLQFEHYGCNSKKKKQHYSTTSDSTQKDEEPSGRCNYSSDIENVINDQIIFEFRAAANFFVASCYFGRSDIGLKGASAFFKKMYEHENLHAMALIDYQLLRGGCVKFVPILVTYMEPSKLASISKALEITLVMERSVATKFENVIDLAVKNNDKTTEHFINHTFLTEQHRAVRAIARLLTNSQNIGFDGFCEYVFDKEMETAIGHVALGNTD